MLLVVLAIGLIGTGVELLLLGHDETPTQVVPLVLIAVGVGVIAWHVLAASPSSLFVMRVTMGALVAAGVLGIVLHYQGSVDFQKEMDPSIEGFALFTKVMQSQAPPPLAPGALAHMGLVGLVCTYPFAIRREKT